MSIASLAIAVAYLLLVVVGFVAVLLLLVWLFRETPSGSRTWREPKKSVRNAKVAEESTTSASDEIKLPEDRAA